MADAETAAREMGWRPKEEFRGEAEKWVDAETFVSRGEHFLPHPLSDRIRVSREEPQHGRTAFGVRQHVCIEFTDGTEDGAVQLPSGELDRLEEVGHVVEGIECLQDVGVPVGDKRHGP